MHYRRVSYRFLYRCDELFKLLENDASCRCFNPDEEVFDCTLKADDRELILGMEEVTSMFAGPMGGHFLHT